MASLARSAGSQGGAREVGRRPGGRRSRGDRGGLAVLDVGLVGGARARRGASRPRGQRGTVVGDGEVQVWRQEGQVARARDGRKATTEKVGAFYSTRGRRVWEKKSRSLHTVGALVE